MSRFTAYVVLALLLSGCATTRQRVDSLGIAAGDYIVLPSEGALVGCKVWQSTPAILFSPASDARCLIASSRINKYHLVLSSVPAGSRFKIARIKHLNLVDREDYLVYLQRSAEEPLLIVQGYEFSALMGRSDEP